MFRPWAVTISVSLLGPFEVTDLDQAVGDELEQVGPAVRLVDRPGGLDGPIERRRPPAIAQRVLEQRKLDPEIALPSLIPRRVDQPADQFQSPSAQGPRRSPIGRVAPAPRRSRRAASRAESRSRLARPPGWPPRSRSRGHIRDIGRSRRADARATDRETSSQARIASISKAPFTAGPPIGSPLSRMHRRPDGRLTNVRSQTTRRELAVKQTSGGGRDDSRFQRFQDSRAEPRRQALHDISRSVIRQLPSGIWNLPSGIWNRRSLPPPLNLLPERPDVPEDAGELVEGELGLDGAFDDRRPCSCRRRPRSPRPGRA